MLASAILGMGKLEGAAASEELAPPLNEDWTFDELPRSGRAEGDGTMVLSSAGNHMLWVPDQGLARKSQLVLPERNPPSVYEDERNYEVDYNDESPDEDGGTALESTAAFGEETIIQRNAPTTVAHTENVIEGNGKGEEEPDPRLGMGAGATTIARRNAVLTQKIMMDLAATKQIRLHTSLLHPTQQQAGLEEDAYDYDELDGY